MDPNRDTNTSLDVAIVGAGPTGLLLAGDLARAGVRCAVLERKQERSGLTRAFAVHARTLEELDARGVADELIATGIPDHELKFFGRASLDLSQLNTRFPFLLVTPQYETERVLEQRANRLGADIRYGTELTDLTQHSDHVDLKTSDSTISARYVVGADGMHSTVRQAIGMPFPGGPVVQSVMLAEVQLTQTPPDTMTVGTIGDAFALVTPFCDGWFRIIAWHRDNQPPEDTPVKIGEVAYATRAALGTDYGMHDPRWMSRFHSDERQVPAYRDGRVLLAGDAAHVHSPAGGQGMNTSIQDAANLGWKLAAAVQGWAPDGLLDSYNIERHPVGRQVLRASGTLLRLGFTGPPALTPIRNTLAAAAMKTPVIARYVGGMITGLSISYPAPPDAHPLAGHRAEDLPLTNGQRLYQALNDRRFVLAAPPGALPADTVDGYDDRVVTVTLAQPDGAAMLIRPDAYVAWAGGPAPPEATSPPRSASPWLAGAAAPPMPP